ncbi:hypothetical protein EDC96DRAFT_494863 [Choanephora cucurbitarum]|nr:hypothetical protein EDC96DRAFT_534719 [Choanephora cucurbitarum]KAI8377205.1 hypothetical protein EDC96DRAFT_494863 [Choanephora cucurbitarum]
MDRLKQSRIELIDVPQRWWISKADEYAHKPLKSFTKPWVKYLLALDEAFRVAEGDVVETSRLTYVLDDLLHTDNNSFVDGSSRTKLESGGIPPLQLPEASEVRKPGRPPKSQRLSSLPKDFANASFRKQYSKIDLKKKQEDEEKKKEDRKEKSKKRKPVCHGDFVYDLYIPKKRATTERKRYQHSRLDFLVHESIDKLDVVETHDPKGDGFCGFRSAAHAIYGDEDKFIQVKEAMLNVLGKKFNDDMTYADFYSSSLGMIMKDVKMTIICGIDQQNNSSELRGEPSHTKAKVAQPRFWFDSLDCMQILADAYGRPVCYYPPVVDVPEVAIDQPASYFPVILPAKLDKKPLPIHIQNINGCHWGSIKFSNSCQRFPAPSRVYIDAHESLRGNFDNYWNRWKQFHKQPKSLEEKETAVIVID